MVLAKIKAWIVELKIRVALSSTLDSYIYQLFSRTISYTSILAGSLKDEKVSGIYKQNKHVHHVECLDRTVRTLCLKKLSLVRCHR